MRALCLALLLLPVPSAAGTWGAAPPQAKPDPLAARAAETVRSNWPAAEIAVDPALSAAAAELAKAVAEGLALEEAARPERVRLALARAGALAPDLAPMLVRATGVEAALSRLRERLAAERTGPPPARVGIAVEKRGGRVGLALLRAPDRIRLDPFPAEVAVGSVHRLSGRLEPPLRRPTVHLSRPGAKPVQLRAGTNGPRFSATLSFPVAGHYTVEVMAEGPRGPEVAALLDVWAGQPIPRQVKAPPPAAEPATVEEKEALAARLVNELRRSRGLPPLRIDPVLGRVARRYAEELVRTGSFAHHSPTSGSLADRLARGGYRYRGAGENLAQAPTVQSAHDSTVHSPGHLANLLGDWEEAGFGVAVGTLPGGTPTLLLVEVFASPAPQKRERRVRNR